MGSKVAILVDVDLPLMKFLIRDDISFPYFYGAKQVMFADKSPSALAFVHELIRYRDTLKDALINDKGRLVSELIKIKARERDLGRSLAEDLPGDISANVVDINMLTEFSGATIKALD